MIAPTSSGSQQGDLSWLQGNPIGQPVRMSLPPISGPRQYATGTIRAVNVTSRAYGPPLEYQVEVDWDLGWAELLPRVVEGRALELIDLLTLQPPFRELQEGDRVEWAAEDLRPEVVGQQGTVRQVMHRGSVMDRITVEWDNPSQMLPAGIWSCNPEHVRLASAATSASDWYKPFAEGDRVRVKDDYPGKMHIQGWLGTVARLKARADHWAVVVRWDDPQDYFAVHELHPRFLERGVTPPRFTSVEEADAWLEAHAV